jgi:hypothetical protein
MSYPVAAFLTASLSLFLCEKPFQTLKKVLLSLFLCEKALPNPLKGAAIELISM